MEKILIIFAHPAKSKSKINIALRKAVEGLENVTIHDLYSHYPDFMIDVKKEQKLCEEHDVIIFQHPFYWYSTPAIIKEWFDLVLEHGWAYGSKGNALKGKYVIQALTAGGDEQTYSHEGKTTFTIEELTSPFKATAQLCKMNWLPTFTVLGIHRGLPEKEITVHAEHYRKMVLGLRDSRLDMDKASTCHDLNHDLDQVIKEEN